MAVDTEMPHTGLVSLVSFGPDEPQVLLHRYTGESLAMTNEWAGLWRLMFVDGYGELRRLDAGLDSPTLYVNDVLNLSLHGEGEGMYIYDRKLETSNFVHDKRKVTPRAFDFSSPSAGSYVTEVYEHSLPHGVGCHYFLTVPYMQHYVFGSECHSRWVCRHYASWVDTLRGFGIVAAKEHLRRSAKSLTAEALKAKLPVDADTKFSAEAEYSMTMEAAIHLLAHWACPFARATADTTRAVAEKARNLLGVIVKAIVKQCNARWPALDGHLDVTVVNGQVLLSELLHGTTLGRAPISRMQNVYVTDTLLFLADIREGNKHIASAGVELATDLFRSLAKSVAVKLEVVMDKQAMTVAFTRLPTLRLAASVRPRRVPMGKKSEMVVDAARTPGVSSTRQVCAIEQFFCSRRGLEMPVQPRSASRFVKDHLYRYFVGSRQAFHNTNHLSIVCDATRVSGEDLMSSCFTSVEAGVTCWAPPQVLRDSRTKDSTCGVAFTAEEHQQWQSQLSEFFKVIPDELPAAKRRRLQKVAAGSKHERLASLDWLRAIEHSMIATAAKKFDNFDSRGLLKGYTIDEMETVRFDGQDPDSPPYVPSLLVMCTDQCSTQLCPTAYTMYHLGLNMLHMPDPYHMEWNDIGEAMAMSGFQPALEASLIIFNLAYGPFQKSAFFNDLKDAAVDCATSMTPNDLLLTKLWPSIMQDHGMPVATSGGEDDRTKFLSTLAGWGPGVVKGPKAATSRWFSYIHAAHFWDEHWHTRLLLILFAGIRKGWARSLADVWCTSTGSPSAPAPGNVGDPVPIAGECAADEGKDGPLPSAGAAAASSDAAAAGSAKPGPASVAQAQREAKAATQEQRGRSANTMHAVARLLCNPELLSQIRLITLATRPLTVSNADTFYMLKGYDGNQKQYVMWASWSWLPEIIDCIKTGGDVGGLGRAGLIADFSSRRVRELNTRMEPVLADDALFLQYWNLVFSLARSRCSSMTRYSCGFPGLLAGLLSEDRSQVAATFASWKELHEAWTVAAGRKEKVVVEALYTCPF